MSSSKRTAFSLIELLVVVGIVAVIGIAVVVNLNAPKASADLLGTAKQMTSVLRQAQSQAMSDQQGNIWGVYFSNPSTGDSFYAIISSSTYSSATVVSQYDLPSDVGFVTSTLPQGSSLTVQFTSPSGASSASTSVAIYLTSDPSLQENVVVLGNGQVSYTSGALSGSFASSSPSQNIWIADTDENNVEEFNASGTFLGQLGCTPAGICSSTSTNGGFHNPYDLAFDSSGNILVLDGVNDRVEKFNASGTYISQIGICGSGACTGTSTNGGFKIGYDLAGIAIDASGNIWVSDPLNSRVEKLSSSGAYISQLGNCSSGACSYSTSTSTLVAPAGIAIDSSGNVWVADSGNNRVIEFSSGGAFLNQLGCTPAGSCASTSTNGGFNNPSFVAFDSSGNIWVADDNNNRVEKFSSSGTYISQLGICGSGSCASTSTNGGFYVPYSVGFDENGNIWVSDFENDRVEKFSSSGTYISQLGCSSNACTPTGASGTFGGAFGLTIH